MARPTIKGLEARIKSLEADVLNREGTIGKLNKSLVSVQTKLATRLTQIKALEERIEGFGGQQLAQIVDAKEQALSNATKQIRQYRLKLEGQQRLIESLTADLTAAQTALETQSTDLSEQATRALEDAKANFLSNVRLTRELVIAKGALEDVAGAQWPRLSSPLVRRAREALEEMEKVAEPGTEEALEE